MRKFTKIQFSKINKIFTFLRNPKCKNKQRVKKDSTIRNNVISIMSTSTTSTTSSNLQRSNNLLNLLMDEILIHINTYNQENFQDHFSNEKDSLYSNENVSLYSNEKDSLYSNEKDSLYSNENVSLYSTFEECDLNDIINLSDFFS
jgi:hypothetical protein